MIIYAGHARRIVEEEINNNIIKEMQQIDEDIKKLSKKGCCRKIYHRSKSDFLILQDKYIDKTIELLEKRGYKIISDEYSLDISW